MMFGWESVSSWLKSHVTGMRLSRLKTLSAVVSGAMRMKGVGVLALGRAMEGPAGAKHRIKRVWRFLRNPGVENLQVSRALFTSLIPAKGRIIVLCDWTDLAPFKQLVFSLPKDGRSLPFLSLTIMKDQGEEGAMVEAEQKALAYLAVIAPKEREVVIVADRGFGNARWIKDVKNWGWHFVQRIAGNLYLNVQGYSGSVSEMPIVKGTPSKDWGQGNITQAHLFEARVVTIYDKDSKEPWVLLTDLQDIPPEIVRIYKRRMWIEAMFRDLKNRNWGLGLDATRLSEPARHDRLFIVLAVAYALLMAFGAAAEASGYSDMLKANTENDRVMTLARIGNYFIQITQMEIHRVFKALLRLPM
jgi:hypothetical protein